MAKTDPEYAPLHINGLRLVGKPEKGGDDAMARCAAEYLRDCPHLEAVCYGAWCLDEHRPASAVLLDVLCWTLRGRFGYRGSADKRALMAFFSALMELKPSVLEAVADAASGEGCGVG